MTYDKAFGEVAATDEDWSSPEFDYLQPYIRTLLDGPNGLTPTERERAAQRCRNGRPYLIAQLRKNLGDPKWDPRGARVLRLPAGSASNLGSNIDRTAFPADYDPAVPPPPGADDTRCCELHNRNCEPPSELCCSACTEAAHPDHWRDGSECIAPDLSTRPIPPGEGRA